MLKVLLSRSDGTTDIAQLCQTINWSGDWQQCARSLEVELIYSPTDKIVPVAQIDLGNGITLMQDNRTLFMGFVVSLSKSTNSSTISVKCFDFGFYLKRNKATYQFKGQSPEAITRRVCSDFGIKVGTLATGGIAITRNFIGCTLYDIIMTAYTLAAEQNGKKYICVFRGDQLCVQEKKVTDETLVIEGGSNLMDASTTNSIENMVNQVVIYDKNDRLIRTLKDDSAVKLYGVMQEYLKQSGEESVAGKAEKLLQDNGVAQKVTVNSLGNVANVTGGTVVVREPHTGLYGLFYIDGDAHTWKNGQYYNKLTLNFKSMMDEKEVGSLPNKTGSKTKSSTKTETTTAGSWAYKYNPDGTVRQ